MERRAFIALIGGGAIAWPLRSRAQQPDRTRRIGVLMGIGEDDPGAQRRVAAFQRRLHELGWETGRNLLIDYRWRAGAAGQERSAAKELAGLPTDVMVAHTILPALALAQASGVIPIVFTGVGEPIFYGLVESLARPGGNVTGFSTFAPALGGRLLELLKEMAPRLTRVAVVFNPGADPTSMAFAGAAAAAAEALGVESIFAPIYAPGEIEAVMAMLGREPGSGLILPPGDFTSLHQPSIIALAARHRLPAIYGSRQFTAAGGLMSYGIDPIEQFQAVAVYVDRILRGEPPAQLAVLAPTKFELVINLKTAQALGLAVPSTLLARADEAIE
ncbi:MAG TPA: ABC transporter substrate-binding protein [Xanthobacteraceae bacterium]|jgi:putative ABC transport system substrate-binding protein